MGEFWKEGRFGWILKGKKILLDSVRENLAYSIAYKIFKFLFLSDCKFSVCCKIYSFSILMHIKF
jgi:hypothetical protein